MLLLELFQYSFMRRALLTGLILAIVLPLIGMTLVLRRTSMMGDALSHASLAGVAGGLAASIDPVLGALIAGVLGALCIDGIRRSIPRYADVAIAVVSAVGAGLAGILSAYIGNTRSLDSYLFGSIVAVSNAELALVVALGIVVLLFVVLFRHTLFVLAIDEKTARASGVSVAVVDTLFAIMTGVAISISARAIGSLVVSSMLVLPVAASLQLARGYKNTNLCAVLISCVCVLIGLATSYFLGWKPGGTIVIMSAMVLVVSIFVHRIRG